MLAGRFGPRPRSKAIWLAMWVGIWLAIGLVAAVLVTLALMGRFGGEPSTLASDFSGESTQAAAVAGDTIRGGPPAVNEYLLFVARHAERSDANRDHDYTADGLRRLAAALSALLQFDPGSAASQRMQIVTLYRRAEDLQGDPTSPKHAEFARDAFMTAAEVSQWIQERDAPTAAEEVKALRAAAMELDPNVSLLQQTSEVERYFVRAGEVVRTLVARRDIDGGRTA